MARRVLLVGLDCVPPALAFERYRHLMPRLSSLMAGGSWGPLRSCLPPITLPAWTCMLSGRDPGELGLYGFRKRRADGYGMALCDATDVAVPRLWDRLGAAGYRASALWVPPSHPPAPIEGELLSCLLTPGPDSPHSHPPALAAELRARFGPYRPDVESHRAGDPERTLGEVHDLSAYRFAVAAHLWRTKSPDFLAMVDIGPDRFHHAFWQHIDPAHPRYRKGNPHAGAGERYYAFLDARLDELLAEVDEETVVLVVSDHGARPLRGAVALNELLVEHGYLVLKRYPQRPTPLSELEVDWSRTRAFGEGGYCGRVYLNLQGREPQGVVAPADAPALLDRLAHLLASTPGAGHRVVTPAQVYRRVRGRAPDLMAFFGDLDLRAVGSVGHGTLRLEHNDTGEDGCNHDWEGIFVMAGGGVPARGRLSGLVLQDVHATVLGLMDVPGEPDLLGRDLSR